MTRALYRGVVRLHPAAFRKQFGEEMLCIFDEAGKAEGTLPLLLDAVISLARQWTLRSGAWKVVAAACGAWVQVIAALGLPVRRVGAAPHGPVAASAAQIGEMVQITILTVFGLLALIVATVVWTTRLCRQRR
jgi:hypothetical protein